jgi:hypothetical protein
MSDASAAKTIERFGRLLDRAVRALGEAGRRDAACRLAAEGWWLVKEPAPRAARRLNATLHYLTVYSGNDNCKEEPNDHERRAGAGRP